MLKIFLLFLILYFLFVYGNSSVNNAKRSNKKTKDYEDPFDILFVSKNSTVEEIKRAYREQSRKNHPDHVAHMAPDFQHLAEDKLKKINWAYQEIRKIRGF